MDGPHLPDITPIQIDPNSVVELLKNLTTHKAAGPDSSPTQRSKHRNRPYTHFYISSITAAEFCSYHLTGKEQT